jgi:type VI secretion system secreted protein Hcp
MSANRFVALVLSALAVAASPAHAALNAYLILKGTTQGDIKGEVTLKGRENQILVYAFEHAQSATAPARKFHVVKPLDKATPLLRNALEKGEAIASFELRLWRPMVAAATGTGSEEQYLTITLTGARVISIKATQPNTQHADLLKLPVQEEVTFSYSSSTYTYVKGGITGLSTK